VKKKLVLLAGLAALGITAYVGSCLLGQAQAQQGTPAPASPKVGMINLAVVLKGYNKFKVYNDEIENIRKEYQKKEDGFKDSIVKWQQFAQNATASQADKEKAEKAIKDFKRMIEDNVQEYNKVRSERSDKQMVQMYHELESAVQKFAGPNGFHLILHYSEPTQDADKYSAPNIQRKLVGPGQSGGVCPIYMVPNIDVSADIIRTLNELYPAPAGTAATPAPAAGGSPPR
jgi:Skp family chaperone for outer membrane proteins